MVVEAERVEPRHQRVRPGPHPRNDAGDVFSRINWDRVGRVALVVVLLFVLGSYIRPTMNLLDHWRGSKTEQVELSQLKQRNLGLRREIRELDTRQGLERAARKVGMIREGERAYVVREGGG